MATKTEIALKDNETAILDAITLKKEELTEWVKTADNYVVTPQTLKEANAYRIKGKNYRLEVQRISKSNNDKLNKLKKINGDREDEFVVTTGLEAAEKRFEAKIKLVEDDLEAERLAKLKAEEDRKRAIKLRILEIENKIPAIRTMTDIKELNLIDASLVFEENSFEEFNEDGNSAIKTVSQVIQTRIGILEDEKELQKRILAKVNSRKEFLENYPITYWPSDEELNKFTQEEFEEAIVHIQDKVKADEEDSKPKDTTGKVFYDNADVGIVVPNKNAEQFVSAGKNSIGNTTLNWKEETLSDTVFRRISKNAEEKFQEELGKSLLTGQPTRFNLFAVNGYSFGLDPKITFDKAILIRTAIEMILTNES